ncbi:hypothetical protein ACRE_046770 [Hapsidospora chrysogenum ATCC 11550]|uniref:Uncharacterized protein n=1 Tax=Hapsidospora chrysogenum (strain ATCC 11550 / CBS 779.69 / DSM 880 / IAM 14645 / JCM 23072 / IMI 49137) TaxID=857340 RepID=A0A086T561_HAPC1|nr:hypothetical protein ACRE_046770 [Hapsidospora chrysogenum ATCC 11550]
MGFGERTSLIHDGSGINTSHAPPRLGPLTCGEIRTAVEIVRKAHGELSFRAVSLLEPSKAG